MDRSPGDTLATAGRVLGATARLLGDRWARPGPDAPPRTLTQLGPRWLERALRGRWPGLRLGAVRVLDRESGTSARARLALEPVGDGAEGLPATLFAKLAPAALPQRLLGTLAALGGTEVAFYRTVRPELPVRAPEAYAAVGDPRGVRFALLLEDLAPSGAQFRDVGAAVSPAEAGAVVDALARLHAAFWESPGFRDGLAWVPSWESRWGSRPGARRAAWERTLTRAMLARTLRRHGPELPAQARRAAELLARRRPAVEALWARGPRTLVHGDCHAGNLFFEPGGVGLLDWQVVARAPGLRDVSYFLCTSLPVEARREHEAALLERWAAGLEAAGVPPPAPAARWEGYRHFALYAWLAAAFTAAAGAGLQSERVARAGLRRASRALADLASADAVERVLGA